jgi:hypothetical protein
MFRLSIAVFGVLVVSSMPAHAGLILTGPLTGANPFDGSGFGSVSIDNFFDMSVNISFSGLPGAATSASFAGFSLLLPFPSDTSGSASGTFVIDSGVEASLAGGGGTFTVSFSGGDGQISGQAIQPPEADSIGSSPPVLFLPPPVPEPGTWAMLGLGLGAIAFRLRSRRR